GLWFFHKFEIEAAIEEGVKLITHVSPIKIQTENEHLTGIDFIKNELGELDETGRARFIPIEGSEHTVELDTLIVAIGEQLMPFELEGSEGLEFHRWGAIKVDPDTLTTTREGVFAGGDIVTGPNTVVDAIAAGKKGALMIDRYLNGEPLRQMAAVVKHREYIDPHQLSPQELEKIRRAEQPKISLSERRESFTEVEQTLSKDKATTEAMRCLRCDLEFVEKPEPVDELKSVTTGG
ncbi:FAD-dependent oxidoreductase, partial [candidate division CSSED10-310 bacterium]